MFKQSKDPLDPEVFQQMYDDQEYLFGLYRPVIKAEGGKHHNPSKKLKKKKKEKKGNINTSNK